jgi:hypothetical protein
MAYDEKEFWSAVEEYKKDIKDAKGKSFLIVFDINNEKAFYSIAPLSRALHELGADVNATGIDKKSDALDALNEVYKTYDDYKMGIENEKTEALMDLAKEIDKKMNGEFDKLLKKPDFVIVAKDHGFEEAFTLPFKTEWHEDHRKKELMETCKILWRDLYNLQANEKVGLGFTLVPNDDLLGHPLWHYLDSYAISMAMAKTIHDGRKLSMGAYTVRDSMLAKSERISELKATLLGLELCKDADEEIFKKFKILSNLLNLKRFEPIDASFFISGKGYGGKHLFGEMIGYPSLNGKTRWQSPGQFLYKLDFYPQTEFDDREPFARVGFTETLPIDIFIETNKIDWMAMHERDLKIKGIVDKCDTIRVVGEKIDGHKTDLEIGMVKPDGERRTVKLSDTDIREKINSEYLEKTGIKAGTMANIPGGEAFMTPESMKGTFVGDVVISLDQSYLLSDKEPLIIETYGDSYKVISGPKDIMDKFDKKKKEAWENLMNQEKHKSLPKETIELKKKNFNRIGEFAINTNPNAKLCDYLIVNEKIANMMHIAMGSGFEADRATEYHTDVVINSPRQKMDIYGIDKEGNEHWIIKKGKFIV